MARPTRGRMRLFGQEVPAQLPTVIDRVGAVVESPKFSPNFSGRRNLRLLAALRGIPDAVVDGALDRVGLSERADDRYKGYSLGMKQRLAIAATLLKTPDLLILDEPTNGLDPAGIREIRDLVRGLGEAGVTVLISSHILAEVQQVCTSATIIGRGRVLAAGRVEDLLGGSDRHRLRCADLARAGDVLTRAGWAVERDTDALVVSADDPEQVTRVLAGADVFLTELTPLRADLETVFLDLTAGEGLSA